MKKLILFAALVVCGIVVVSCAKKAATPSATTEKALKCIQDKDFKGYLDLVHFKAADEGDAAKLKQARESFLSLLESKMTKELDSKEGLKEWKINEEKIEENKAVVKYHIIYGNGEEKDDEMKLIKTESGEWMIDSGK